jgi:hypothetical protein
MPPIYGIIGKGRKLDLVDKLRGVFRVPSFGNIPACVWVEDADGATFKIAEERYRLNGYKPDADALPTEEEYEETRNG